MSCTLKELQDTEYEILCKFADFCDKYKIEYILSGGTLLGAIRHNGFIPWDDDVDVHMDSVNFKKFVRKIKKHPIFGMHLSWVGTDLQHPNNFAKLRKLGTFMPEDVSRGLDICDGVWLDIFVYTGYPKNKFLARLKEKVYYCFSFLGRLYLMDLNDRKNNVDYKYSFKYRLAKSMPDKMNGFFRKILFSLYTRIGSKKSEFIVFNDWSVNPKPPLPRTNFTSLCKHAFRDREFSIAANYDDLLSQQYGDYMTPKEYPSHSDFSKIDL